MRIKKLFITMLTLSLLSVNMPFTVFAEEVNIDEASEDTDNEEVSIVEETSSTEESSGAVSDTEDGIEETIDETSEESLDEVVNEDETEDEQVSENEADEEESESGSVMRLGASSISTEDEVTLTFDGTTVTASDGNDYEAVSDESGNYYLTVSGGSYILKGAAENLYLSVGNNTEANFVTDGLTVNNDGVSSAFITAKKNTAISITLRGSSQINYGAGFISQGKNSTLDIGGSGSLTVESPEADAIKTKGTLNITGGNITLTKCEEDGIQAEDLNISGGVINIDTYYLNAATSYYTSGQYRSGSSDSYNYLWESGDTIKYERVNVDTGSHKGIKVGTKAKTYVFTDEGGTEDPQDASGTLNISGGKITIDTRKSGLKANALSTTGYTATASGKYIIGSPDDALQSNNDIVITGGEIDLYSGDDGVSAMGTIDISDSAEINIYTAYEGIEGQTVNVGSSGSPEISIWSTDDGINTSGKTLTYTYDTYSGFENNEDTGYVKKSVSSTTGNNLTINGGTVKVYIDSQGTKSVSLPDGNLSSLKTVIFRSSGDGLDCNGSLTQNRGEIYVYGQSSGDNSPIDTNDGYTFNSGAKVLGTGVDGMNESKPERGSGSYLTYGSSEGNMPGNGNGNPPEMPENRQIMSTDSLDESNTVDEAPSNGDTPPEIPDNGNGPENGNGPGNGQGPENGGLQGNAFSAGQYWVVTDASGKAIDCGKLEYSGSFIVYGSNLIDDGTYTLQVMDSEPEIGSIINKEEITEAVTNEVKGSFSIGDLNCEYTYTAKVSYNGAKIDLSDLKINGQGAGSSISGNVVFKKVRYKNNKKAGEAYAIPVFKAEKGADKTVKKAVNEANKYFRKNPLIFDITERNLSDITINGTAVYRSSSGKWRFNLKADTGLSKLQRIKIKRDFTVVSGSYDEEKGTVMIQGCGNYTGTATISGVVKK